MKKKKINIGNLEIRQALPILVKAVKLTREQGLTCRPDTFSSWEEIVETYGENNLLREGEDYEGYLLVWRGGRPEVNRLSGSLRTETNKNAILWAAPVYKEAFARGALKRVNGALTYVWCIGDMRVDERLITKLTTALSQTEPIVELDEREEETLLLYLGEYYFQRFFQEI